MKLEVEWTHTVEWDCGSLELKLLEDGQLVVEQVGVPTLGRFSIERDEVRQLVDSFEACRKRGWSESRRERTRT